jgi:DNA-directed RNA polymerase II subunit RPB1
MNAAVFSQYDILNGVTENIMLGQLGKLGTGVVDLLVDTTKLVNTVDFNELDQEDVDQEGRSLLKGGFESMTPHHTPFLAPSPMNSFGGFSSMTPMAGAFTPQGIQSPFAPGSTGYQSPRYGYSPGFHQSASPGYVTMSPARSAASPAYSASPGYNPNSPAYRYCLVIYFCYIFLSFCLVFCLVFFFGLFLVFFFCFF